MGIVLVLMGKYLYLVVILLAIVFVLLQPRETQKKMLMLAVITLPLTYIVAWVAGHLYYDPRPFVAEHIQPLIVHAANNGFPSDHTLITSALAAVIFIYNRKWGIGLGMLALLVGVGRIYARIHSPIDILGSFVISGIVVAVVALSLRKFSRLKI